MIDNRNVSTAGCSSQRAPSVAITQATRFSQSAVSTGAESSARAAHRRPPYALEGMKRNQPLLS